MSKIFRSIYVMFVLMLLSAARISASSQTFTDIISFGDSLTDIGNVAGITIPGNPPVIALVPCPPGPPIPAYYQLTHFSDNIIWIETLANFLGLPPRTPGRGSSTTLPPLPNGNDWAWGGSEAAAGFAIVSGVTEPVPNLLTEVDNYLALNTPDPSILYSIWSGADNFLIAHAFGPEGAAKAVRAIVAAMIKLEQAGARNFLIFNLPQLGDTPAAIETGNPISRAVADIYTEAFNKDLSKAVKKLCKSKCFNGNIYFVDIFSEFERAVHIVDAGFPYVPTFFVPGPPVTITNVTDPAIDLFVLKPGTFAPNFLFWDPVHPTTQGHQVVAGLVLQAIGHK